MHALSTSVDMNSRTSTATGLEPSNSGMRERRTRVMNEQDLVSLMRRTWVQKRTTGFKMRGVLRMNNLVVSELDCEVSRGADSNGFGGSVVY